MKLVWLLIILIGCSANGITSYTPQPTIQVFTAEYLVNELDAEKIAIIGGSFTSDYGDGWFEGLTPFEQRFTELGGRIVYQNETNLTSVAEFIVENNIDAVLIGEAPNQPLPTSNNAGLYGILREKEFKGAVFAIEQGHTFKKSVCLASESPILEGLMIVVPDEIFNGKYKPETIPNTGYVVLEYDDRCNLSHSTK